ncbi:PH domain-containing protein [Natronoglycomyces albus]|uniref:PH domain-containing protein n=1 Tax=Natronoglycomyces albus TaxID=2811108 RepID=A0A895XTJ8_9ACTN|nr:PH domain-containing protein [Natronoglycomyces albus]QSB06635.1 PH domain-containing protein [Natronoglycomyces albus]
MRQHPVWDFWPNELSWQPMPPQLTTVWLLGMAVRMLILLCVLVIGGILWLNLTGLWLALGIVATLTIVRSIIIVRAVKAWGFAERDRDILVKHGLLTRRLSIVPYGRIQLVDIKAGPIERIFDLTSVQVKTAALDAPTVIPGLEPEVARALRDRLARLASEAREGL